VECTTSSIDNNDKLAKLAGRGLKIRDQLAVSGAGAVVVLPVIVTTEPRATILGDLEKAADLGISVVCKEDIEQIASTSEIVWDTERVFTELRQRIPLKEGDGAAKHSLPF